MTRRTNVAAPLSTFFGREDVLEGIAQALARGDRVVTLVGPPGIGKTRSLLRFGEMQSSLPEHAGEVWFLDLVEAKSARDLCLVTAGVLGQRVSATLSSDSLEELLASVLAERGRTLLLCDNFEQLPPEAALVIESWCRHAQQLQVLVSSRQKLGLPGEVAIEIRPLAMPAAHETDRERLLGAEAMGLFVDRARAAGHPIDDEDLAAVAALVRELDGVPLALELAAARSNVMSPRELLARLAVGHDVLSPATASATNAPGRLRSLHDAVERSWTLLAAYEQRALVQCSFFVGEFSLAAAEAVLSLDEAGARPIVDVLASLREKSLLGQRRDGGATRFRMVAGLRSFARARARANPDEERSLAERHRAYFVSAAAPLADEFWRTGDARTLRALEALRVNLTFAMEPLIAESPRAPTSSRWLARGVAALEPTMSLVSEQSELLRFLDAGAMASREVEDRVLEGRILVGRGAAYGLMGEHARAVEDLRRACQMGRDIDAVDISADALIYESIRTRHAGGVEESLAMVAEASRLLESARVRGMPGWPRIEGACAVVAGMVLGELHRPDEARRENLRAQTIFSEAGDRWSEALALANLAQLAQEAGDFDDAARRFDAALGIFREYGDRRYEARYAGYRAALEHERGRSKEAGEGYQRALALLRGLRVPTNEALLRACLGALLAAEGRIAAALEAFERADGLVLRAVAPVFAAAIDVHRGHIDLALARQLRRADPSGADQHLARARHRLDHALFTDVSQDVRFAARLLTKALTTSAPTPPADGAELTISPGTCSFSVRGGPEVDLRRRGSLRRMLAWLVARRIDAPNEASHWSVLLAQGWPGERVSTESGATRVRVAIATLRKLGLADLLTTRDDGYLIDARASVHRQDDFNEP